MAELSLDSVAARRPDALSARVDDELVLLDPRTSLYFGLDRVGRRVWDLLEEPRSIGELCATLEQEFDVAPEDCHADVIGFVARMAEADLVELS
jgi:hypothetical protein